MLRLVYFEVWLHEGGRTLGSTLPCTENCIAIAARRAVVETSKMWSWKREYKRWSAQPNRALRSHSKTVMGCKALEHLWLRSQTKTSKTVHCSLFYKLYKSLLFPTLRAQFCQSGMDNEHTLDHQSPQVVTGFADLQDVGQTLPAKHSSRFDSWNVPRDAWSMEHKKNNTCRVQRVRDLLWTVFSFLKKAICKHVSTQ